MAPAPVGFAFFFLAHGGDVGASPGREGGEKGVRLEGIEGLCTYKSLTGDMDVVRPSGQTREGRKELVGALPEWRGVESELGPGGR